MLHDNYSVKVFARLDDKTANRFLIYCQDHGLNSSAVIRLLIEGLLYEDSKTLQHDQL